VVVASAGPSDGCWTGLFSPGRLLLEVRNYLLRRARAPHWELRVDVSPEQRVTQIAFGERAFVGLDEGCA
jgi:hypothetical protein